MTTDDDAPTMPDAWLDAGLRAAYKPHARQVSVGTGPRSVLSGLRTRCGPLAPPRLAERVGGNESTQGAVVPSAVAAEGRYKVLGELARGGVGVILKGRDVDLGREVAMKVLRDEHAEDADLVRRFVEEAQIAGQLQHPGIVPVYELGMRADGRPYFTMKLVNGHTLAVILASRRDPGEDRTRILSIFEAVCQTVAYAHARGVIHRDLKPSNVMVGAFGEVQVVDWGLAKVLGHGETNDQPGPERVVSAQRGTSPALSRTGSVMGTPRYMPPEQALGAIERVDERADVFALGGMLCEILTGVAPYPGEEPTSLAQARQGALGPAHARLAACGAPSELVELATACLASEREARPRNAGAVAAIVAGWRAGVEERARAAESEAVEARARADVAQANADHERRARRLTLGVAVLGTALLSLAAVGWRMVSSERSARAMETLRAVEGALGEAAALGDTAGRSDVPEAWNAAVSVARRASSLAQSKNSDAETQARARGLLLRLEEEARISASAFDLRRRTSDLASQGYTVEAIAAARRAIELRPKDARARIQITELLSNQGQLAEAVEHARAAVEAQPDLLRGRQRLAGLLQMLGDGDGALAETRAWAQLAVDEPDAQFALGRMLLARGEAEEAVEVLSRAARSWPDNKDCAQALEGARVVARRAARLPALLRGEYVPSTTDDWIEYAQLCSTKELYVAGAGLWEHILGKLGRRLADAPFIDAPTPGVVQLGSVGIDPAAYRVEAAVCTLAAGLGKGKDAGTLDDAGRKQYRDRALAWLEQALKEQQAQMEMEKEQDVPGTGMLVLHLVNHQTRSQFGPDTPLGKAIEALPEDERSQWHAYRTESEAAAPIRGFIQIR